MPRTFQSLNFISSRGGCDRLASLEDECRRVKAENASLQQRIAELERKLQRSFTPSIHQIVVKIFNYI